MSLNGAHVDIVNEETDEILESYFIKKHTISSSARRYALFEKIKNGNHTKVKSNQLVACANISTVLCDAEGNLLYPEPINDDEDNGYMDLYHNFDETIFYLLASEYAEVNPIGKSLKSKKKKS